MKNAYKPEIQVKSLSQSDTHRSTHHRLATTIIASLLCVVATLTSNDCLGLVHYV